MKALFIGGPFDGRIEEIGGPVYEVAQIEPVDKNAPPGIFSEIKRTSYEYNRFYIEPIGTFPVMVPRGVALDFETANVLRKIIKKEILDLMGQ